MHPSDRQTSRNQDNIVTLGFCSQKAKLAYNIDYIEVICSFRILFINFECRIMLTILQLSLKLYFNMNEKRRSCTTHLLIVREIFIFISNSCNILINIDYKRSYNRHLPEYFKLQCSLESE